MRSLLAVFTIMCIGLFCACNDDDDQEVKQPDADKRLVSKIVAMENANTLTFSFSYDELDRIVKIDGTAVEDGVTKKIKTDIKYSNDTIYSNTSNDMDGGTSRSIVIVNEKGYAKEISNWFLPEGETMEDEQACELVYADDYLSKSSDYDEISEGGRSYNAISTCTWTEGDMTRVVIQNGFDEDANPYNTITQIYRYSEYLNTTNLDLNKILGDTYIQGAGDLNMLDIFGKRCKHLVSRIDINDDDEPDPEYYAYEYEFDDNGLLVRIIQDNDGVRNRFELTYK